MRRRCILGLVILVGTAACHDDVLLAPATPTAAPLLSIAGGTSALRSGYGFVCTLRTGVVTCYGDDDEGQPIGVHRAIAGSIVYLAAGATHACGVRSDGAVECWGSNKYGQAPALRRPGTGSFMVVSGGTAHSCAVRSDGVVECWGLNTYGQAPAVRAATAGRFTQVTAASSNSCALRNDGVIECWGRSEGAPAVRRAPFGVYVRLAEGIGGNTNCALTSTGVADCWGYRGGWRAGPYIQLGLSGGHNCALRTNQTVDCWGYPLSWQGPEERSITGAPEGSVTARTWTRVSVGAYHSCGLREDGHFECFGEAQSIGSDAPDVVPNPPAPSTAVASPRTIRVEWEDINSNEQRTEIERSIADSQRLPTTWTGVSVVGGNREVFVDSVAEGMVYVHRIRACNAAGCSRWKESNATALPSGVPPAPKSLNTNGYACGTMSCARLTWTSDITFVETFRLQRRTYSGGAWGAWSDMLEQPRSVTTYNDYNLTPGVGYQYRVQGCNTRGCSSYTAAPSFVAVAPPPPSAPADLTTSAMGNYMYLAWGDVATEERWEIQRREQTSGVWGAWVDRQGAWMNDTHQEDPITPSTLYQYRIRACNQGGCSAYTTAAPTQT